MSSGGVYSRPATVTGPTRRELLTYVNPSARLPEQRLVDRLGGTGPLSRGSGRKIADSRDGRRDDTSCTYDKRPRSMIAAGTDCSRPHADQVDAAPAVTPFMIDIGRPPWALSIIGIT